MQYFDPDKQYRVLAEFVTDTITPFFKCLLQPNVRQITGYMGYLHFILRDTLCKLTAYQNMDFKNSPEYDNTLFVPFMDNTNGLYTYGGGRYMDIRIPEWDRTLVDFNLAYNPYCAYASRWSCPLVPFENDLNVSIIAREKIIDIPLVYPRLFGTSYPCQHKSQPTKKCCHFEGSFAEGIAMRNPLIANLSHSDFLPPTHKLTHIDSK